MKANLKSWALLISLFVSSSISASQTSKQIIYVDFDSHAQLQLLKHMDVLGVNLKQHWAEVSVTKEELIQLQAKKLHIRKANYRLRELTSPPNDGYLNPTEVRQALTNLHNQYSSITNLFEAGRSHRDLPIMALEISAHPGDPNKPVLLFNALHHAREVMTPEVIMHMAKELTQNYGHDLEVTSWLDNYRVILVPQVNPDGNTMVSDGKLMWRKNAYQLNGHTVGVDLNRNYPTYWNYCQGSSGNPESETYRGPDAGSEPETKTMMHLVETFRPVVDISYHSYSELIIYPFGCRSINNPAKALFHSIGMSMNANIRNDNDQTNSYVVGSAPEIIYEADGSDLDWQWREFGVFAYTIEVNGFSFRPNYKKWRDITVERQEGGWKTLFRRMSQSGFRAQIQTNNPDDVRYSLYKIDGSHKLAFDGDSPDRTFTLRSASGLMYQLAEKGSYEVTFYLRDQKLKTIVVEVGDSLVDLGVVEI